MVNYQDEPDWANVLLTLYDEERSRFRHDSSDSDYSIPESHLLVGEGGTGLSRDEVDNALVFLRDSGLMEVDLESNEWEMTEKGFSIAHERVMTEKQESRETERAKRQNNTNKQIVNLTLAIVFMHAIDTSISTVFNFDKKSLPFPKDIIALVILALSFCVIVYIIWRIGEYDKKWLMRRLNMLVFGSE